MFKKIGFIGLGLMGTPMCTHIQKAGFHLTVWNRTTSKCQPFINNGALLATTPHELANETEVIILCLTDELAVKTILFEKNGILEKDKNLIIVDHSTIAPASAKSIAKCAEEKGAVYLDAPVTGSVPGAIKGTLITFVGGNQEALLSIEPILKTYSTKIAYMGENSLGQATKMCNQVMLHNTIISTFETMNLAIQQGLNINKLVDALEDSLIHSKAWEIFGNAAMVKNNKLAHIKDLMKDINYVESTATATNSPLYLTSRTIEILRIAMNKGMGMDDVVNLIKLYNN